MCGRLIESVSCFFGDEFHVHFFFCRENPERFPAVAETWQLPLLSSNDIYHNINRKPQCNEKTRVIDWGIYEAESPCILDLLRKLKNVKNAPRKLALDPHS